MVLFDSFLKDLSFKPNRADHCFYTLVISTTEYVLLLQYVNDVISAGTSEILTMKCE